MTRSPTQTALSSAMLCDILRSGLPLHRAVTRSGSVFVLVPGWG